VTSLVLDAGAFVAIDKTDRRVGAMLRVAQRAGLPVRTSAAAVAQVWRSGARQANLARVLAGVEVRPLDDGRSVGQLLAASGTADVVDAHVALVAQSGDRLLTSDPHELALLVEARGVRIEMIRV
jgi:hypothetical protein